MRSNRSFRHVAVVIGSVLALGIGSACTADEAAAPVTSVTTSPPGVGSASLVGPDAFAERLDEPEVVVINVHVPDEGSIAGTDLTIAFDQIIDSSELPTDLDTPLAVYCRSDTMSADAVADLEAMGYTDIVELDGGFKAWVDSGRPLEPAAG